MKTWINKIREFLTKWERVRPDAEIDARVEQPIGEEKLAKIYSAGEISCLNTSGLFSARSERIFLSNSIFSFLSLFMSLL